MMMNPAKWAEPGAMRRLILASLAVFLFQAVFWYGIEPLGKPGPIPRDAFVRTVDVAALENPVPEALENAQFKTVKLMWSGCCDERFYALRHLFTLDAPPKGDLGLIAGKGWDNIQVYLNGQRIRGEGPMAPLATYHGQKTRIDRLPMGLLREGENRLEIITARNKLPYTDFRPLILWDYEPLKKAAAPRLFMMNDFKAYSGFLAGLIAAIAIILLPRTRNRAFAFWLGALAGFYCLRNFYYMWAEIPLSPNGRLVYYFLITNALSLAWLNFIDSWTGHHWRWLYRISLTVYGVMSLAIACLLYMEPETGYHLSSELTNWFGVALGAAAIIRFVFHLVRHREDRMWEIAAFSLCLAALFRDIYMEILYQSNLGYTHKAAPFLLFALIAAIISRNVRIYDSMASLNAALGRKIADRESELRRQFETLQAEQKARTLAEERQRILRDMHDGIGHELIGMILQARGGKLSSKGMVHGLESSLNDLRLVVESLSHEEPSLERALARLRERLARQMEAANLSLDWTCDLPEILAFDERDVLQICRIIQEATTNALRHSGTQMLKISIAPDGKQTLRITIRDFGKGLPAKNEAPLGRGLTNMRARASQLNGSITIENADPGTAVSLSLPLPPNTP